MNGLQGLGTLGQAVDQEADKMLSNPDNMKPASIGQDMVKALAMQRVKSQLDASQRDINMALQTPKTTIMEDYEKELIGNTQNEMTNQVEGVMNQKNRAMGGGARRPMPNQKRPMPPQQRGIPMAGAPRPPMGGAPRPPMGGAPRPPMGGMPRGGIAGAAPRPPMMASGGIVGYNKGSEVQEPRNTSRSPNQSEGRLAAAREAVRKLGPKATKQDLQRILQQSGGDPAVKLMLEPFMQIADTPDVPSMPDLTAEMQRDFTQNVESEELGPVITEETKEEPKDLAPPSGPEGYDPTKIRTAAETAGKDNATAVSGAALLGDTKDEKGEITQKGVMSTLQDRVAVNPMDERGKERDRLQGLYGVAVDPKKPEQKQARADLLAEPAKQEALLRQAEDAYMTPEAKRKRDIAMYEASRGSQMAKGKLERQKMPQKMALARKNRATNDMNSTLKRVEAAEAGSYQMFRDMAELQTGALNTLSNIASGDAESRQQLMKIAGDIEGAIQSAVLKKYEVDTTASLQQMIAGIKSEQELLSFYADYQQKRMDSALAAMGEVAPRFQTLMAKYTSPEKYGELSFEENREFEKLQEIMKSLMYTDTNDIDKMFSQKASQLNPSLANVDLSTLTDALGVGTDAATANKIGLDALQGKQAGSPSGALSPAMEGLFNRFNTKTSSQEN